ncbi:MAG: sec-independent protein translocase protein TatB, partial [Bradyrhizobium sp.]|nr:sec-independent protein translocase protein TatB [Bradyrhizobium sp.]
SLQKDVSDSLRIDDISKPETDAQVASAIGAPATSKVDAPEAPTPETFSEADVHAAGMEPLAITREVQAQPAPQEPAPDILKDAKAS